MTRELFPNNIIAFISSQKKLLFMPMEEGRKAIAVSKTIYGRLLEISTQLELERKSKISFDQVLRHVMHKAGVMSE